MSRSFERASGTLRTVCKDCGHYLIAVEGSCGAGVVCVGCGSFLGARDYIMSCLDGVSMDAAKKAELHEAEGES